MRRPKRRPAIRRNAGASARLRAAALVAALLPAATAHAQLVTPLKAPRLTLGISSGAPEVETEVQLRLAGPPDMAVGRIEAVVTYPAALLDFDKVSGYLIAQDAIRVAAAVREPKDGRRALELSVESSDPARPLPAEVLANLVFKVAKDVEPQVLDLDLQAKAFGLDREEIGALELYGGRVNIQDAKTFFACFFYMH